MNGDTATSEAATSAAARPTGAQLEQIGNWDRRCPATSNGARSDSGVRSTRVDSQAATKKSGGVISASPSTVETTPQSPFVETIQDVDSSSANTL